jgi:hypothetical protein
VTQPAGVAGDQGETVARLIFVEGFPGAGKSTTAQFLARLLARRGSAARWVYEEETPHPLVPPRPSRGYPSWETFTDARVARWRAFASAARDYEVTVIPESALLQTPVAAMLMRNADPVAIETLVRRLVESAAPLAPALVYLARRDPDAAFRGIGERRGMAWLLHHVQASAGFAFTRARRLTGLNGLLTYWRAHAELCEAIVDRLDLPKLVIDAGVDSVPERRRRICDFLDVPFDDEPPTDAAEIARMTGRYGDGRREATIEVMDGRLVLRGILWFTNALLPVTRNVFDIEAWPVRVVFEEDATGSVRAFRCSGPRLAWGSPSAVFARIAA